MVCISFLVFDSLNIDERLIDNQIVGRCQSKIRSKLSQDFFTPMFHPLSPQAKRIICKLAKNVKGLKFNSSEARKITGMENNQISPYFGEFIKRGILTKPSRGTYWIFHTLFKEYLIFNSHKHTN